MLAGQGPLGRGGTPLGGTARGQRPPSGPVAQPRRGDPHGGRPVAGLPLAHTSAAPSSPTREPPRSQSCPTTGQSSTPVPGSTRPVITKSFGCGTPWSSTTATPRQWLDVGAGAFQWRNLATGDTTSRAPASGRVLEPPRTAGPSSTKTPPVSSGCPGPPICRRDRAGIRVTWPMDATRRATPTIAPTADVPPRCRRRPLHLGRRRGELQLDLVNDPHGEAYILAVSGATVVYESLPSTPHRRPGSRSGGSPRALSPRSSTPPPAVHDVGGHHPAGTAFFHDAGPTTPDPSWPASPRSGAAPRRGPPPATATRWSPCRVHRRHSSRASVYAGRDLHPRPGRARRHLAVVDGGHAAIPVHHPQPRSRHPLRHRGREADGPRERDGAPRRHRNEEHRRAAVSARWSQRHRGRPETGGYIAAFPSDATGRRRATSTSRGTRSSPTRSSPRSVRTAGSPSLSPTRPISSPTRPAGYPTGPPTSRSPRHASSTPATGTGPPRAGPRRGTRTVTSLSRGRGARRRGSTPSWSTSPTRRRSARATSPPGRRACRARRSRTSTTSGARPSRASPSSRWVRAARSTSTRLGLAPGRRHRRLLPTGLGLHRPRALSDPRHQDRERGPQAHRLRRPRRRPPGHRAWWRAGDPGLRRHAQHDDHRGHEDGVHDRLPQRAASPQRLDAQLCGRRHPGQLGAGQASARVATVTIHVSGTTHVIADVSGYFSPPS